MATNAVDFIIKALADKKLTMQDIADLVAVAQTHIGVEDDGLPGPATLAALTRWWPGRPGAAAAKPAKYLDRREHHVPIVGGKQYVPPHRAWSEVKGVCLHQTACDMGVRPERYDTCGAHFAVLRDGTVLHLADMDTIIYHGNGWNNQTVGIEINGLFAGVEGDPSTCWDDPSTAVHETAQTVTPEQIAATKDLIRWIKSEVAQRGVILTKLVAHRQSSKDRRDDPGSKVWQTIALPLKDELNLVDGGPGFEIGGYPIPEAWDPSRKGLKY